MVVKHVYFFGRNCTEGRGDIKNLLGDKGAGLADMARAGLPVPPGFTITTDACRLFLKDKKKLSQGIEQEIDSAIKKLGDLTNTKLNSKTNPLFLSVRPGAEIFMPGMMDTMLNLGMNDLTVIALARKTGNSVFAYDSYKRFIQMFGSVVKGIDKDEFEKLLIKKKRKMKVLTDQELGEFALEDLISEYKDLYRNRTGQEFPHNPIEQLKMTRNAVFHSWNNPMTRSYRDINNIPHDMGTAVNIQAMVFGNMGNHSATGVGFTRNPATGEKELFGKFLLNAQGKDVVAGIRPPKPIEELDAIMPQSYKKLKEITTRLERHYKDIQEFEFTIQEEKLYMLQTRNGERTGAAAVKIAVDMVSEGIIGRKAAVRRVAPNSLNQLLSPIFSPKERSRAKALAHGLAASPGAAVGKVVFTADDAVTWHNKKEKVVLVRKETMPCDIHGMAVSVGVLTATGGMTSHAAMLSRQMGKPAVVGCGEMEVREYERFLILGGKKIKEGDVLSIDGTTGDVFLKDLPTINSEIIQIFEGEISPENSELFRTFEQLLKWAGTFKKLQIRANADTPQDAKIAQSFGAAGIGLCRSEHSFFAEDRAPIVQSMIFHAQRGQLGIDTLKSIDEKISQSTDAEKKKLLQETKTAESAYKKDIKEYTDSLKKLRLMQKRDFIALFKEMKGNPVTIRTLDPPLRELLPNKDELVKHIHEISKSGKKSSKLAGMKSMLAEMEKRHEFNPMLGHRGCRLGLTFPEITRMQAHAIFSAVAECSSMNIQVNLAIIFPMVGNVKEFKAQKEIFKEVAKEIQGNAAKKIKYSVGTVIELPQAALAIGEIAGEADLFSFATNGLTQTTLGISRDDSAHFMPTYLNNGIFHRDPFISIDKDGVGALMKVAIENARKTRSNIVIGACGEHAGEPESVEFFHRLGLKYISCSPFRIPIAIIAAAQAALKERAEREMLKKSLPSRQKQEPRKKS